MSPAPPPSLICRGSYVPDPTTTLMIMSCAARTVVRAGLRRPRQLIDWTCRELFGEVDSDDAYHRLGAAADAASAGSGGIIVSPHVSGRVAPAAPTMRGAVIGLSPISTREDLARATLEAIAFEYRGYAELSAPPIGAGQPGTSSVWVEAPAMPPGTRSRLTCCRSPIGPLSASTRNPRRSRCRDDRDRRSHAAALATAYGPTAKPDVDSREAYDDGYRRYRRWTDRLAAAYADESAQ